MLNVLIATSFIKTARSLLEVSPVRKQGDAFIFYERMDLAAIAFVNWSICKFNIVN